MGIGSVATVVVSMVCAAMVWVVTTMNAPLEYGLREAKDRITSQEIELKDFHTKIDGLEVQKGEAHKRIYDRLNYIERKMK